MLSQMPLIRKRLEEVSKARLLSATNSVKEFSKYPSLFTQDRQPNTDYLAIPEVSSERRKYIPIAFLTPNVIASNKIQIIPYATLYIFGVMSGIMHMIWTKYVSGRLKSDISYSPSVYNNFPWPENPSEKQVKTVEEAAQKVLDVREKFLNAGEMSNEQLGISNEQYVKKKCSLADLYDPLTMPPELVKAHQALDKAVDLCYRPQPFPNETKRIEFLFELYDKYTAGLFAKKKI